MHHHLPGPMEPSRFRVPGRSSGGPSAEPSLHMRPAGCAHPYSSITGKPVSGNIGVRQLETTPRLFSAHHPVVITSGGEQAAVRQVSWVCCGIFETAEMAALSRDRAAIGLLSRGTGDALGKHQKLRLNYHIETYNATDVYATVHRLHQRHPHVVTSAHVAMAMANAVACGARLPDSVPVAAAAAAAASTSGYTGLEMMRVIAAVARPAPPSAPASPASRSCSGVAAHNGGSRSGAPVEVRALG